MGIKGSGKRICENEGSLLMTRIPPPLCPLLTLTPDPSPAVQRERGTCLYDHGLSGRSWLFDVHRQRRAS